MVFLPAVLFCAATVAASATASQVEALEAAIRAQRAVLTSLEREVRTLRSGLDAADAKGAVHGQPQVRRLEDEAPSTDHVASISLDGTRIDGTSHDLTISTSEGDTTLVVSSSGELRLADDKAAVIVASGDGKSAVNAALVLQATDKYQTDTTPHYRGTGTFMHDEGGKTEWFTGRPYASSDSYVIGRQENVSAHAASTAHREHRLLELTAEGDVTIAGTLSAAGLVGDVSLSRQMVHALTSQAVCAAKVATHSTATFGSSSSYGRWGIIWMFDWIDTTLGCSARQCDEACPAAGWTGAIDGIEQVREAWKTRDTNERMIVSSGAPTHRKRACGAGGRRPSRRDRPGVAHALGIQVSPLRELLQRTLLLLLRVSRCAAEAGGHRRTEDRLYLART